MHDSLCCCVYLGVRTVCCLCIDRAHRGAASHCHPNDICDSLQHHTYTQHVKYTAHTMLTLCSVLPTASASAPSSSSKIDAALDTIDVDDFTTSSLHDVDDDDADDDDDDEIDEGTGSSSM